MLSCSVGAVNDCNEGGFHAKTVPATTSGSWKNSSSGRRSNTSLLPINPRTTSPSPLGPSPPPPAPTPVLNCSASIHDSMATQGTPDLALIKVAGAGDKRVEALRLADAFRASVIDANVGHFIFEITGKPSKIDQFIAIMAPLGLIEVCRTGIAALNRGDKGM